MPQYSVDVIREVLDLLDAGRTQGEVSRQTKVPQPTISRWVRDRRINPPNETPTPTERNGNLPTIPASQSGAPTSAPVSAPRVDALEQRVQVLEAFIASLQRQPAHFVGALNGAPRSAPASATKKRGFVIACDLSDALDTYASASGHRVTDILDRALRLYLGEVAGTEVHP